MASPQENYKQFEKLGEEKVQENLALGLFRSDKALAAEHWLTQRSRRRSRFRQTIETIAKIAAIVVAVMTIIAAVVSAIQWLPKLF